MAKIKVEALASEFNMDVKAVLSTLNEGGLRAKRRNSSVDEDEARRLLGSSNVVSIKSARKGKKKAKSTKSGAVGSPEWYAKYPHVVKGSVREPNAKDKKLLGFKCHGKVCTIKCVDTGEERVINTQDAFQVKRTVAAQHQYMKQRRAERRAAQKQKKQAKNA